MEQQLDFASTNLPIDIKNGNEYLPELKKRFTAYKKLLKSLYKEDEQLMSDYKMVISIINKINKLLVSAIESYVGNNYKDALECVDEVLSLFVDTGSLFISDIKESLAFDFPDLKDGPIDGKRKDKLHAEFSFFRARILSEYSKSLSEQDMLHVPFNQRGKVLPTRFGLLGLPSLYLGTSTMICWEEMNRPILSSFNVSSFKLPKNLKILSLVYQPDWLAMYFEVIKGKKFKDDEDKTFVYNMFFNIVIIWPLICATSFNNNSNDEIFRAEYIIGQLIVSNLKDTGIDGVAYLSNKKTTEIFNHYFNINLSIPAKYKDKEQYDSLVNDVLCTRPINLQDYVNLPTIKQKSEKSAYLNTRSFIGTSKFAGIEIPYSETIFGGFDDFLEDREFIAMTLEGSKKSEK